MDANDTQRTTEALEEQKNKHYAGIFIVLWTILSSAGALLTNHYSPDWTIVGAFAGLILAIILSKAIVN